MGKQKFKNTIIHYDNCKRLFIHVVVKIIPNALIVEFVLKKASLVGD